MIELHEDTQQILQDALEKKKRLQQRLGEVEKRLNGILATAVRSRGESLENYQQGNTWNLDLGEGQLVSVEDE